MVYHLSNLSPQQARVYRFLRKFFEEEGKMPSLREICQAMGWRAIKSAQDVVQSLINKGFLEREDGKSRALRFIESESFRSVPILGTAPAGKPVEAIEHHLGYIHVPAFLKGPVFAVRVQGDSMVDAGIRDGDLAIVKQVARADHGEIVVALLEGEVSIKRLIHRKSKLWLKPENPRYSAISITDPSFRILGKLIGIHRYWES